MKINKIVLALGLAFACTAYGQSVSVDFAKSELNQNDYTSAVVKKIDLSNNKITLKHEAITHLDMPSMVMVFKNKIADQTKIDKIKVGDNVKAYLDKDTDGFVVKDIKLSSN